MILVSSFMRFALLCRRPAVSHDDDIRAARLCRLNGVKHHGGGVGALVVLDNVHAGALGPDGQLLGRRCAERVRRGEEDFFALAFLSWDASLAVAVVLPTPLTPTSEHDGRAAS